MPPPDGGYLFNLVSPRTSPDGLCCLNWTHMILSQIHDILNVAGRDEFGLMAAHQLGVALADYLANYAAAMIEYAVIRKGRRVPSGIGQAPPEYVCSTSPNTPRLAAGMSCFAKASQDYSPKSVFDGRRRMKAKVEPCETQTAARPSAPDNPSKWP